MIKAKKSKIVDIVFICLFSLVLLFFASITVKLILGQTPSVFGYSLLYVETDSMEPCIPKQSLILVKSRDFNKNLPKNNEIVVFYSGDIGALKTHRVVDESPKTGYIITKGDNAQGDDGLISIDNLKFIYVKNLSLLSFLARAVRNKIGFLLIVIIPGILVLISFIVNIFKQVIIIKTNNLVLKKRDKITLEIKQEAINEYKNNLTKNEKDHL